jgi:hypothetical protein
MLMTSGPRLSSLALASLILLTLNSVIFAQNNYWELPQESEFHFARLAFGYDGRPFTSHPGEPWLRDYPEAEYHFMGGVNRLTNINADGSFRQVSLLNDALFDYPFLYAVKVGFWNLNPQEVERLREYLVRGGTLIVDDFHGPNEWFQFVTSVRRLFPDKPIIDIPDEHEAFQVHYNLDDRVQVVGANAVSSGWEHPQGVPEYWRGIADDDDRIMMFINFNMDLGDAWEHADDPYYPEQWTALAYRIGINYLVYSITH